MNVLCSQFFSGTSMQLQQTCTFQHKFPFMLLFYFSPFKFYLYKKFKLSINDYLLLIYTFMCMVIFLRILIISFQSHQTRIRNAGLGMAWNQYGLSCSKKVWEWHGISTDCPAVRKLKQEDIDRKAKPSSFQGYKIQLLGVWLAGMISILMIWWQVWGQLV